MVVVTLVENGVHDCLDALGCGFVFLNKYPLGNNIFVNLIANPLIKKRAQIPQSKTSTVWV